MPRVLPKILLLAWGEAEPIADALDALPAQVLPTSIADAAHRLLDPSVAACVLLLSRPALSEPHFAPLVRACSQALGRRQDFRLFVHLEGITRQELDDLAPSSPALADLLDLVQFSQSERPSGSGDLVENVAAHIERLPALLTALQFERWKQLALALVPLSNLALLLAFVAAWWQMTLHPQAMLESAWLPWILASLGVICYWSLLALGSFGSSLRTGGFFRIVMAAFPLWLISTIPSSKLVENWAFLLAGLCASILLDSSRRMWAQSRREHIRLSTPREGALPLAPGPVVGRRWQMLTTAPLLGGEARVFISYSHASPWGKKTALELHAALKVAGVRSFLDAEDIAEGTSWRHKLQREMGRATVFVAIQDALTSGRYWPNAELLAALESQRYCGLPTLIILRHASLAPQQPPANLLESLLVQKGAVDPSLLRVIDYQPDTPRHLALGLANFNAVSLLNPALAAILQFILAPVRIVFSTLGTLGPGFAILAGIAWLIFRSLGVDAAGRLQASGWGVALALLGAYWLGFILRLAFASRFELRAAEAPQVFWVQLLALAALAWVLWGLAPGLSPLWQVYAGIACGFGFLLACDFIAISLPASGKSRPRLE